MRKVAMSLSAAANLFVMFFLCAEVQSNNGWGVTYSPSQRGICALKGSTVEMKCEYRYPHKRKDGTITKVTEKFWFTGYDPVSLETQKEYEGRVTNSCDETRGKNSCTLRITDLKESDSAVYKFRFITNLPSGSYTGELGIRLSVTDPRLTVSVQRKDFTNYNAELKCSSSCVLPSQSTYVWYENGWKINNEKSTYLSYFYSKDSISCAIKGHEDFPAPLICVRDSDCNKVIYSDGRICAAKGSSVSIRSSYYPLYSVSSNFWFRSGSSVRRDHSEPENIELDPQYTGRVKVTDTRGKSTLIISNLRESDSGEYRFIFQTNYRYFRWGSDFHGTTLTVIALQVQVVRISANQDSVNAELRCRSSCSPAGSHYTWFKNGKKISYQIKSTYKDLINSTERISCALWRNEEQRAPEVYAPVSPSLSADPSAEIIEGSSVTLRCSSEANPPANYTWYKKTQTSSLQLLSRASEFLLNNIQSSDSGEYYCEAENQLGKRRSTNLNVDVKYAPKPFVVSTSHKEVVELSSLTLTCSSDANPEPSYSWYKDKLMPVGHEGVFHFPAVKSADSGTYYCRAENKYGRINSSSVHINVEYPPRLPSVSVNPPGEIVVGGSVNLTCSSDANPAATYAWYKENTASSAADGPMLTIVDIRHEDGGNYYCEARNSRGQHNSTLQHIMVSSSSTSAIAGSITFLLLVGLFVSAFIIFRKKMASRPASEIRQSPRNNGTKGSGQNPGRKLETPPTADLGNSTDQDDLCYASVHFSKKQEEPVYSNFIPAEPKTPKHKEEEEEVEYSVVMVKKTPSPGNHDASEEACALYSTVNKVDRL